MISERLQLRVKYEASFWDFCLDIGDLEHLYEPLHKKVCDFLQEIETVEESYHALIIPRGCFKTTLVICYVLWRLARDPTLKILLTHASSEQSRRVLGEIKRRIVYTKALNFFWPEVFPKNPARMCPMWGPFQILLPRPNVTDKTPSVLASSVGSAIAGTHFDLVIPDDVVDQKDKKSELIRERKKEYMRETEGLWEAEGESNTLDVGTRWHYDDAHAVFIQGSGADGQGQRGEFAGLARCFMTGIYDRDGSITGKKGAIVFPRVRGRRSGKPKGFTQKQLERKKARLGPTYFAAFYLNEPLLKEAKIFRRETIRWFKLDRDGRAPLANNHTFYVSCDPNRDQKARGDPCAIVSAAWDEDGDLWVTNVIRGHPGVLELVEWIVAEVVRWGAKQVMLEVQNFQAQIEELLRKRLQDQGIICGILPVNRTGTASKFNMISGMEALVANGRLHLREGMEHLAEELEQFDAGEHDDMIDALSFIHHYGRRPEPSAFRKAERKRRVEDDDDDNDDWDDLAPGRAFRRVY